GNKPLLPENIENLYKAAADAKSTQQNESRGYKEPADTREEQDYDSQAFHDTASEAPAENPHWMIRLTQKPSPPKMPMTAPVQSNSSIGLISFLDHNEQELYS